MPKCWRCDHELICSGNFMASECGFSDSEEDKDAIVTDYSCPHCGTYYQVVDTPESEKEYYKYWNEYWKKHENNESE